MKYLCFSNGDDGFVLEVHNEKKDAITFAQDNEYSFREVWSFEGKLQSVYSGRDSEVKATGKTDRLYQADDSEVYDDDLGVGNGDDDEA